jgi:hypothetical protein
MIYRIFLNFFAIMFSGEKVNNFCGGEIAARLAASGNLLKPGTVTC